MSQESKGEGEARSVSRKPTIAIVDDDEIVLASTAEMLERADYRVLTRDRPAGCVAMMLQEKPDLVLLDVCMPTVAGDTLVKLFSKAAPNSGTIILLYSALDEPLLKSKAKASGAHGYIIKTNDGAALLRAVRRWLRPSVIRQRVTVPSETAPLERISLPGVSAPGVSMTRRVVQAPASSRDVQGPLSASSGELRKTSGSYQLGGPTILFVDDDMTALSGYRRQLHGQPFEFDFALSGSQALRLLTSATPPGVVVSDLLMPDPSGAEVLRRALDIDISWNRRFVIVTGLSPHEAKSQLDRRFAGAVLPKPTDTNALLSAIRSSLAYAGLNLPAVQAR
jgi:two-component system, OmpR family, response regulator